jgi:hypothetical protein
MKVLFGTGIFLISVESLMWIGRWSEPREVLTDQMHEGMMLQEAMLRSGAVLAVAVTRVGRSSLRMPRSETPIQSAISN